MAANTVGRMGLEVYDIELERLGLGSALLIVEPKLIDTNGLVVK